ncbi:MAG: FeoB-associated Cys-rich membrane protein [Lachnospiraceae bacterium]|nr:FeoB-associated Cys-rich membrane protein [Lachnospiraceae bacterium]
MLNVLMNNAGTILVSLILIGVVILITAGFYKDRKKGRSCCGCNCGCCPMSGTCHKNK